MTSTPETTPPPRLDLWHVAVRSAERHRGSIVVCGPGDRLRSWPDTPPVRATALAPWLTPSRVAVGRTAAWVWGAMRDPGAPLNCASRSQFRHEAVPPPEIRMHQLHWQRGDVMQVAGYSVASPLRTAIDLLRLEGEFSTDHRVACRLLLPHDEDRVIARQRLRASGRRLRARALLRFDALG